MDYSWDAHIAKVLGKGKSQVGKMDAILTEPHLDTRIKKKYSDECDRAKVITRICRSTGRERGDRKTTGNSADNSS